MCASVDELLPLDVKCCLIIAIDELISEADGMCEAGRLRYWSKVKEEVHNL